MKSLTVAIPMKSTVRVIIISVSLLFSVTALAAKNADTKLEKIEKMITLMKLDSAIDAGLKECINSMQVAYYAPEKTVEKNGDYHGLTPSSPLWPEALAAYHRFAEKSCSGFSAAQMKVVYVDFYDKRMREEDIDAFLKFQTSAAGVALSNLQNEFMQAVSRASTESSMKAQESAAIELRKEMADISSKNNSCPKEPWWNFWRSLLCRK